MNREWGTSEVPSRPDHDVWMLNEVPKGGEPGRYKASLEKLSRQDTSTSITILEW